MKRYLHTLILLCTAGLGIVKAQQSVQGAFPLTEVRLLGSPFLNAEKIDLDYILKLNPDKLLSPFLREAGLKPKAESYGNWENTGLDGHTAGHYLTALAQMYAATGNAECKRRLDYMVSELKRCQDARTDGYVGGVPGGPAMWAEVKKGDFNLFRKKWVPWYNIHKLYAGLRDAYLIGGNAQAKDILIKLIDWADQEVAGLSEQQMQNMLNTEQGGMNEVIADVAAITGNKKYLVLAKKFSHKAILTPLEEHQDKLSGLHANTQIPKVIGFERIAELDQDNEYDSAARFFWQTVVTNRSIAIGGNSVREHFNPSDNFSSMIESEQGPETCNSYNMLKLTKLLFLTRPSARYMDYYERTLYNHILSSQRPDKDGGFVYFTPIRPQHYRVYSQPDDGFWCCVGTGMENHGKYGEMIYSHQDNNLYVNLFIASQLNWKERGITLTQTNRFPFQESSQLQLKLSRPQTFGISIRQPAWVKEGKFAINVNGKPVAGNKDTSGYITITRRWNTNDKISIALPMQDHLEYLPDHSAWVSVVHGPIVLAAATDSTHLNGLMADASRFGHIAGGPLYEIDKAPLLIDKGKELSTELTAVKDQPLTYQLADMIYQPQYRQLQLKPFFEVHNTRYMLYWPIAKPGEAAQREQQLAASDTRVLAMSQRTIDQVAPGEQQPESDHFIESDDTKSGILQDLHWRSATGFFSYKMKMNATAKTLQVTYYGEDKSAGFDIYANNIKLAHVTLDGTQGARFFTRDYAIPEELKSQNIVVIKFAGNGAVAGPIYGVRIIK